MREGGAAGRKAMPTTRSGNKEPPTTYLPAACEAPHALAEVVGRRLEFLEEEQELVFVHLRVWAVAEHDEGARAGGAGRGQQRRHHLA